MTEKRTEITVSDFEGKVKAFLSETSLLSSLSAPASRGELPPPMEKSVPEEATVIRLPEPDMLPDLAVNFLETVELRTSVRVYGKEPVTQKELSALLWCTQGVKMALPGGKSIRNVPSAGGRHSFETYLLIQNVEGIKPGLYRFLAFAHALLFVKDIECAREKVIGSFPQRSLQRGGLSLDEHSGAFCVHVWCARASLCFYRCRSCLPEPLSYSTGDEARGVGNRCIQ